MRSFCGVIAFAVPLFATAEYMETRLVLEWRRWLTRELLLSYFADQAYFRLTLQMDSVDNPDQACLCFPFLYVSDIWKFSCCQIVALRSALSTCAAHTACAAAPPQTLCGTTCRNLHVAQKMTSESLVALTKPSLMCSLLGLRKPLHAMPVLQRICDDVPAYVRGSTMIVLGLTRKVFNIFAFSGKPNSMTVQSVH